MNWFFIAIIGHFVFASVYIIEKFLLSKIDLQPVVYAFYAGLLSIFVLVLAPFDFAWMSVRQALISFLTGTIFVLGLLFIFRAYKMTEISRIVPIIGGGVPIFTLIMSFVFLNERLALIELIAFSVLVLGGIIMVLGGTKESTLSWQDKFLTRGVGQAAIGAFLLASSYVFTKLVFMEHSFINGFVWIRTGSFLGAFLFLLGSKSRKAIIKTTKALGIKTAGLVVSSKGLSAFAFILINYAFYLGSVTLVNALQGVQYVFLLIIAVILSKKFPQVLREKISGRIIIQKTIAIVLISIGLIILAF